MKLEFFNKWSTIFVGRLMQDFDLDLLSSVAIIGNAGHESGGFQSLQEKKPLVPGSRGGYGIMQWTGPRRRSYEDYCKRNGFDPADMESNYKYLFVELQGPEGRVIKKLKAVKTLDQKVEIFMKVFLRPGIPHLDSRKVWARRSLDAWNTFGKKIEETIETEVKPEIENKPEVKEAKEHWLLRLLKILLKAFVK